MAPECCVIGNYWDCSNCKATKATITGSRFSDGVFYLYVSDLMQQMLLPNDKVPTEYKGSFSCEIVSGSVSELFKTLQEHTHPSLALTNEEEALVALYEDKVWVE